MQADFAVELGAEDETLELPWPGDGMRYYDLKRHPELLSEVEEALRIGELATFLSAVNSPTSMLESAKCDAWASTEINLEEEIFGGAWKFGCYVDLVFSQDAKRFSFPAHEQYAKDLSNLLRRSPDIPAQAEFLIRRCFYGGDPRDGFYITCYVFGYGKDEPNSRRQWQIALELVQNAMRQLNRTNPL